MFKSPGGIRSPEGVKGILKMLPIQNLKDSFKMFPDVTISERDIYSLTMQKSGSS